MSTHSLNLAGVFVAVVTPFSQDASRVDFESLDRLLDSQLKAGVHGFVACGSTGESLALTDDEYVEVVRFVRKKTQGRVPCVAGISASATARAVAIARQLEELGCDGILLAPPPYNKPTQAGIVEHFRAVHRATSLPLVAYNVPSRTGVAIAPATLGQLSREGIITGIKESSGSTDALADCMTLIDPSCQVVSGDDALTLSVMAYGGVGAISASANVLATEIVRQVNAWNEGRADDSRKEQLAILSRERALFIESNPVPAKTVLALQGVIAHPTVRLPLVPLSSASVEKVRSEFGI
jgi:4-hydroxy-tetrahydrodipicolinate synthase